MTMRQLLSIPTWMATFAICLGFFVSAAPTAEAQCPTPDGLDATSCCTPATANLPTFPAFSMPSAGICWQACMPQPKQCVIQDVGAPVPTTSCTQFTAPLSVLDCASGATLMKGDLVLDYTRTWTETPIPGGPPAQVWRFAAKVDMEGSGATSAACPVPTCANVAGSTAFYYGYVDYSFDCLTGGWSQAVVLYHNCDRFVHNPTLSAVPGPFHPDRTYALVGPDTAANPFTPAIFLPGPATTIGEAMRNVSPAAGRVPGRGADAPGAVHPAAHRLRVSALAATAAELGQPLRRLRCVRQQLHEPEHLPHRAVVPPGHDVAGLLGDECELSRTGAGVGRRRALALPRRV